MEASLCIGNPFHQLRLHIPIATNINLSGWRAHLADICQWNNQGKEAPYPRPRASSIPKGFQSLPCSPGRQDSTSGYGQRHCHVLLGQTRWNSLSKFPISDSRSVGVAPYHQISLAVIHLGGNTFTNDLSSRYSQIDEWEVDPHIFPEIWRPLHHSTKQ